LWARNFSNGRIVYDALGHDAKSINHPEHAKIIRRSANWAIGNIKQN
jgi:type 1 glutamine amidotransferase